MEFTQPFENRHPELVSGSIVPPSRRQRWQAQPHSKVHPLRVFAFDQIEFPWSVPALDLLLPQDGALHVAEELEANEHVDVMARSEPRQCIVAMLPEPADEIGRDPDIQCSARLAGKDVGAWLPLMPHEPEYAERWTLKQVQGDEVIQEWSYFPIRHSELVSGFTVTDWSHKW